MTRDVSPDGYLVMVGSFNSRGSGRVTTIVALEPSALVLVAPGTPGPPRVGCRGAPIACRAVGQGQPSAKAGGLAVVSVGRTA